MKANAHVIRTLKQVLIILVPWNSQSHKFSSGVQGFHLKVCFPTSNLCGKFAAKKRSKIIDSQYISECRKFNNFL